MGTSTPLPRFLMRLRSLLLRAETAAAAACLMTLVGFSIASPLFLSKESLISITNLVAELGIISIGVTLLMIGGHIDLSVGAVVGISSYMTVYFSSIGLPPALAFLGALAISAALGLVNGLLVMRTGLGSFIVTLGTMHVFRGLLTAWTGGFPVSSDIAEPMRSIVSGALLPGGFRMSLVWFAMLVLGATFTLLRTRFGNWTYAIGQNPEAARNLGVPVERTTVALFVLCSLCGGIAGIVQVARFQSVDALRGEGAELLAIAITVIGGTLLTGGYGSAIGSMFGALIFGMVQVGLVLVGAPGYYFKTLVGATLVGAVLVNQSFSKLVASGGFLKSKAARKPSPPARSQR
ncbi:ABC transporter permease [Verminephrobacter eiseniae]|uniref:Xylose transport system permease protein XylH n=1 Tax=Verminephrobacter eiseniae (strain EF01-2) TaxID=391735 RepID=A1WDY2_VEREI|nr:ABC transporter permease [Verminephrobacter eiseniae]ABM55839.1 inner-membrane translocator [Verminephrobacter eiseniae EF01-2]MCW5286220.1 ABC transporter permease [Verminephrobacter eiseniae]MCW5304519.1 ABC transporter permease [Verminephrobacter eiseniae]MCW8180915.1 ABC transporter permease [Verminephrobacter eiseniae]MCW8190859.1 ABC transporter permease [Verminephrobacter eiseniae]